MPAPIGKTPAVSDSGKIEQDDALRLTRRRALAAGAATAAAVSLPLNGAALARERRKPFAREGSFDWGS